MAVVTTTPASPPFGVGSLSAVPLCLLSKASQSIPDATLTAITFATEDVDTDAMHSTSVNTSRITVVTAGVYAVAAFAKSADYNGVGGVYKNGSLVCPSSADGGGNVVVAAHLSLAAADYLELKVTQGSGGAQDATLISFSAVRLSAAS